MDRLYVATGGGTIGVFNTSSDRLVAVYATGNYLSGLAFDPALNLLMVTEDGPNDVCLLNATSGSILARIPVGSQPIGILFDPTNGLAYVANSKSNNLSVFNPQTGIVVAAVVVGSTPEYLVLDNQTDRIFVTDLGSNEVSVIDPASNRVVSTVSVGLAPAGIAYSARAGNVYVVDTGPWVPSDPWGGLSVLNGSGVLLASYTVGMCPWGIASDDANGLLYIADTTCQGLGNVTVFNPASGLVDTVIPDPVFPFWITYDPSTGDLYTDNDYSSPIGNISVINGTSNEVVDSFAVGPAPDAVTYSAQSNLAFVANWGTNNISIVNATTLHVERSVPVGRGPAALALIGSSQLIAVANSGSDTVSLINWSQARVVATAPVGVGPMALAFDPVSNELFVVNSGSNNVTVLNGTSLRWIASVRVQESPQGATFDPEDRTVLVSNSGPSNVNPAILQQVDIIDGSTNRVTKAVTVGTFPVGLAWDSRRDWVYVANAFNLSALNGSTGEPIASVALNDEGPTAWPFGIDYVPYLDEIAVTRGWSITIVDAANNTVRGDIRVGTWPTAVSGSALPDHIFVANSVSGTISYVQLNAFPPNCWTVNFSQTGLPAGASWGVDVNGSWFRSDSPGIDVAVPSGSYNFTVQDPGGYAPTPASGTFSVNYRNSTFDIVSTLTNLSVTFNATGLPLGTTWSVVWNGSSENLSTVAPTISVDTHIGVYPYTIVVPDGFNASPSNGTVAVTSTNVSVPIVFTKIPIDNLSIVSFSATPDPVLLGGTLGLAVVVAGGVGPFVYEYYSLPFGCPTHDGPDFECTPRAAEATTVVVLVTDSAGKTASATTRVVVAPAVGTTSSAVPSVPPWAIFLLSGSAGVVVGGLLFRRHRSSVRSS